MNLREQAFYVVFFMAAILASWAILVGLLEVLID